MSAQKIDLVDFQMKLNYNLDSADKQSESDALLGFTSGGKNWLIKMSDLKEVAAVPTLENIQKVWLAKNWVLGIANFKGSIYTLADLQMFLGADASSLSLTARALLLSERFPVSMGIVTPQVEGLMAQNALMPCGQESRQNLLSKLPNYIDFVDEMFTDEGGEYWYLINAEKMSTSRKINEIEK